MSEAQDRVDFAAQAVLMKAIANIIARQKERRNKLRKLPTDDVEQRQRVLGQLDEATAIVEMIRKLQQKHNYRQAVLDKVHEASRERAIEQGKAPHGPATADPTPEQIRQGCEEIQSRWSDADRLRRIGYQPQPLTIPMVEGE